MPEPLYTLTGRALEDVRRVVREVLKQPDVFREQTKPAPSTLLVYIGKTGAGGISARSGDTPGSGTVTLYQVGSDGDLATVSDSNATTITVTAYNLSASAVAGTTYVQMKQDLTGTLWVDFEDCG